MRDFKIYLTIACLLLTVYIVVQYNKPALVSWKPTLYYGDKIPFGTYIFYHQLTDVFPNAHITNTNGSVYNVFTNQLKPGNYLIVANAVSITKTDFKALVKYIDAGNTVFITAFNFNGYFDEGLKIATGVEGTAKNTWLNFTNPRLKTAKAYQFDKDIGSQYFSLIDTVRATVISKNSAGDANYISYKFGRGKLLLCANPELFSNYSLITPQGADYAERALSYLPAAKNLYWDEYQNHDIINDESPVRVILDNDNLQSAYYLCLFLLLVYVLFEAKRRQRIIPIIEPLKNSTVDFVNVVGRVYYERRDNANIAHKKILYLLNYLRERYRLKTNKLDTEFITSTANKTGIDVALVRDMVDYIIYIANQKKVTDGELITLNQLIEKFYSQS